MLFALQLMCTFGIISTFLKNPMLFGLFVQKLLMSDCPTKLLHQKRYTFHFLTCSEFQMIILGSLKKEKLTERKVCGPIVHQSWFTCRSRKKASNQKEDEKLHSNYSRLSSTGHFDFCSNHCKNFTFPSYSLRWRKKSRKLAFFERFVSILSKQKVHFSIL